MSDFGIYESLETSGHEQRLAALDKAAQLEQAIISCRNQFGDFLFQSHDVNDFRNRVALVKDDMIKHLADGPVPPVTGTMRRITKALERQFLGDSVSGWEDGKLLDFYNSKVSQKVLTEGDRSQLANVSQEIDKRGLMKAKNFTAEFVNQMGDPDFPIDTDGDDDGSDQGQGGPGQTPQLPGKGGKGGAGGAAGEAGGAEGAGALAEIPIVAALFPHIYADKTGPDMDLKSTFEDHDGTLLEPKANWEGYKKKVNQGGDADVDKNCFEDWGKENKKNAQPVNEWADGAARKAFRQLVAGDYDDYGDEQSLDYDPSTHPVDQSKRKPVPHHSPEDQAAGGIYGYRQADVGPPGDYWGGGAGSNPLVDQAFAQSRENQMPPAQGDYWGGAGGSVPPEVGQAWDQSGENKKQHDQKPQKPQDQPQQQDQKPPPTQGDYWGGAAGSNPLVDQAFSQSRENQMPPAQGDYWGGAAAKQATMDPDPVGASGTGMGGLGGSGGSGSGIGGSGGMYSAPSGMDMNATQPISTGGSTSGISNSPAQTFSVDWSNPAFHTGRMAVQLYADWCDTNGLRKASAKNLTAYSQVCSGPEFEAILAAIQHQAADIGNPGGVTTPGAGVGSGGTFMNPDTSAGTPMPGVMPQNSTSVPTADAVASGNLVARRTAFDFDKGLDFATTPEEKSESHKFFEDAEGGANEKHHPKPDVLDEAHFARTAGGSSGGQNKNHLMDAGDSITNLLNQLAQDFQDSIIPLQEALQAIEYAKQIQQQSNPMSVMPPGGVNVMPNNNPAAGSPALGAPGFAAPGGAPQGGAPDSAPPDPSGGGGGQQAPAQSLGITGPQVPGFVPQTQPGGQQTASFRQGGPLVDPRYQYRDSEQERRQKNPGMCGIELDGPEGSGVAYPCQREDGHPYPHQASRRQACYPGCHEDEAHAAKFHGDEEKEARYYQAMDPNKMIDHINGLLGTDRHEEGVALAKQHGLSSEQLLNRYREQVSAPGEWNSHGHPEGEHGGQGSGFSQEHPRDRGYESSRQGGGWGKDEARVAGGTGYSTTPKWNDFHELDMNRGGAPIQVQPHADTPPPMPMHPSGSPEDFMHAAGRKLGGRVDQLQQILDSHQAQEIDGMLVDAQTANLLLQLYSKGSDQTKQIIETAPLDKVVDKAWSITSSYRQAWSPEDQAAMDQKYPGLVQDPNVQSHQDKEQAIWGGGGPPVHHDPAANDATGQYLDSYSQQHTVAPHSPEPGQDFYGKPMEIDASRRRAWSGWGPAQHFADHHKVAGWEWNHRMNGYETTSRTHFACECGHQMSVPGYHNCRCGKIWNAYVIGSPDHMKEGAAEKYICREIPVREDVIVANRRFAMPNGSSGPMDPGGLSSGGANSDENIMNAIGTGQYNADGWVNGGEHEGRRRQTNIPDGSSGMNNNDETTLNSIQQIGFPGGPAQGDVNDWVSQGPHVGKRKYLAWCYATNTPVDRRIIAVFRRQAATEFEAGLGQELKDYFYDNSGTTSRDQGYKDNREDWLNSHDDHNQAYDEYADAHHMAAYTGYDDDYDQHAVMTKAPKPMSPKLPKPKTPPNPMMSDPRIPDQSKGLGWEARGMDDDQLGNAAFSFTSGSLHKDVTVPEGEFEGDDPKHPTFRDQPDDWAKRDEGGKWYRGDGHF